MFLVIAAFLAASAARQRAAATRKQATIRSYWLRPTNAAKAAFVRGAACRKAPPTPPPLRFLCRGLRPLHPYTAATQRTDKPKFEGG